ncbi:hypothetical protein Tco_0894212 [Tanacetum coccineum]|uniref:Uncharacterized protein n=1 Tax=Tanacetum coccineum TaxID=301880 RepID=A0ABQ5CBH8_9ASTR
MSLSPISITSTIIQSKMMLRERPLERESQENVTLSTDDNIIFVIPDAALELELAKSIMSGGIKEHKGKQTLSRALKKKESIRDKPGNGGSNEENWWNTRNGFLMSPLLSLATSSEDGEADDEGDDHVSDTQDTDDEDVKTESDDDDIYKYKIRVRKDGDEEMKDVEVQKSHKGDEEVTDAAVSHVLM